MPQLPPSSLSAEAAHAALISWWQMAGVEVDPALADAGQLLRKAQRRAAVPPSNQEAGLPIAPARGAAAAPRPVDALADATARAAGANSLEELEAAIATFDGCGLKRTARKTVILDGIRRADVLLVGEAPGREEDESGKPFVGQSGQLLDKMLASIGLSRTTNLCITNSVYWRPPGNRQPSRDELAICAPFVRRFVELSAPKLLLFAGGSAAQSLLETGTGILKLRGQRQTYQSAGLSGPIPAFAVLHPAYLLRNPAAKALAWKDLLMIEAEVNALGLAGIPPAGPA